MVTDAFINVTTQAGGMAETKILFETPATLLSGTGILTGPEQKYNVEGVATVFIFTGGSPIHILTEGGTITGGGGVYLTMAIADLLQPVAVTVPVTTYVVLTVGAAYTTAVFWPA